MRTSLALISGLAIGCGGATPRPTQPAQPASTAALEARVRVLEENLARRDEALSFLEKVYEQQKSRAEEEAANEADPDSVFAVDVAPAIKAGQVEGPASAPVTIIKAFDFACPYCRRLVEPLHELVAEYDGKVRVVYMNLVVHPQARPAHLFSCAAAKQGKYLAFKDAFWARAFDAYQTSGGKDQDALSEANILKLAANLKLDVKKLKVDADSAACAQRLEEDATELEKFRVQGTPGLFINGKFFAGAIPKGQFKTVIDEQLRAIAASGVRGEDYYAKEIMGKGAHQFRSARDAKQQP